jgi:hypothetical protein
VASASKEMSTCGVALPPGCALKPGAEGAPVAGVLKAGQVLDYAEQDLLAEVLQIACRHALAIEPSEDQRTIQVRQVLAGIRFAGLGTEQQALPCLVHGPISCPRGG